MVSLVTASQRTVYTVAIGGKRRRFLTAGAAWYALAKSLVGSKYLSAWRADDSYRKGAFLGPPTDAERDRAERCQHLFYVDDNHGEQTHFDTAKWQAYVRRVARKLRALDEYREKVRRG